MLILKNFLILRQILKYLHFYADKYILKVDDFLPDFYFNATN